MSNHRKL